MANQVFQAGDLTTAIRQVERVSQWPVVVVVVATGANELGFVMPVEASNAYVALQLRRVREACQDALKSL